MKNLKQYLINKIKNNIASKEKEIRESDEELEILNAELIVENKAFSMKDIDEAIKEDFKYSVQALEDMIIMEENINSDLKKELVILKYRKGVIESQFSNKKLDPLKGQ